MGLQSGSIGLKNKISFKKGLRLKQWIFDIKIE